jgi:ribosomal protein S18 acetylase RimI-like enzyme
VHCLVATLSDEPVGYAALIRKVQLQFARKLMDLTHLYVMPQLRGQGIGSALISAAQVEARLNNCEALTVGTAPGNLRAAALYRNAGFEERAPAGAQFIKALCRG